MSIDQYLFKCVPRVQQNEFLSLYLSFSILDDDVEKIREMHVCEKDIMGRLQWVKLVDDYY